MNTKPRILSKRAFIFVGVAAAIALLTCGLLLLPTISTSRIGIILLPADPIYTATWQPFLERTAASLKLNSVSIQTWSTPEELEAALANADKRHILFAEVPFDQELSRLQKKGLTQTIDGNLLKNEAYFPAFLRTQEGASGPKTYRALPFSFDPWITLSSNAKPGRLANKSIISIPAKTETGAIAAYGLAYMLSGQQASPEKALALLSVFQKTNIFQPSAFTYNEADAFAYFHESKSLYAYLPLTYFRQLPTDILLETGIAALPALDAKNGTDIVAFGTVIIIPAKTPSSINGIKTQEGLIGLLTDPEVLYGITKDRNTLPATTNTKVRDFHSDKIRSFARNAPSFIFPESLFKDQQDRTDTLEKIRQALVTR